MEYLAIDALSNPVRIKLLCCLSQKSKNVAELIKNCGLAQSAVSQHLIKLKKADLVKTQRRGKYIYYSLKNKKTAEVATLLSDFCKGGGKNV
jgi:ArsR family transcriptional regulator, virulence genes transcriptional regulator